MTRAMAPPTLRQTPLRAGRFRPVTPSGRYPAGAGQGRDPVRVCGVVKIAQFGSWESPVTAETVAAAGGGPQLGRRARRATCGGPRAGPAEGGRVALMREGPDGRRSRCCPRRGTSATGCTSTAAGRGRSSAATVVFTNWADQRLYALDRADRRAAADHAGTRAPPRAALRRPVPRPGRRRCCACARRSPVTRPTDVAPRPGGGPARRRRAAVAGASHHFMTGPRLSPGRHARIAWLGWDHPKMPWDGTELCVAPSPSRAGRTGCWPAGRGRACARSSGRPPTRCSR